MNHPLQFDSPDEWLEAVLNNFDEFLIDHAANEKKASAVALSMVSHYPDKPALVLAMVDLALEELNHYRQVLKLMLSKGLVSVPDEKDPYVNAIIAKIRRGPDYYFIDRLLSAAVIEARGAERFNLLGGTLEDPALASFYKSLARSEQKHQKLFIELAREYFTDQEVEARWQQWLQIEASVIKSLPIRPRLH